MARLIVLCSSAAAVVAAGTTLELGNWQDRRLVRILSGVLAEAVERGEGDVPPCANIDQFLDDMYEADNKYYDARAGARLVAKFVHACGGLKGGEDRPPSFASDAGVVAARERVIDALQAAHDHELTAHWSPKCARVDARAPGFSWEHFVQTYVVPGVPVAIEGLGAEELGPGVEAWRDVEYLRGHFGDTVHRAGIFDSSDKAERMGIMPRNATDAGSWAARHNNGELLRQTFKEAVPLKALLDPRFHGGGGSSSPGRSWFVEQSALWDLPTTDDGFTDTSRPATAFFPEMFKELRTPSFTKQCALQTVNFWAGALDPNGVHKTKNSALHFDKDDGFLHQISGRKTWTLFHRFDSQNLYMRWWHAVTASPPRAGRKNVDSDADFVEADHQQVMAGKKDVRNLINNFSPVHPHAPDLSRFPRFAKARPMVCETGVGDTIFIPAFTWHDVNSTHAPGGINSAVNFWTACQPPATEMMIELVHDTLRLGNWERQYGALPPFLAETLKKHKMLFKDGVNKEQEVGDRSPAGEGEEDERRGADDDDGEEEEEQPRSPYGKQAAAGGKGGAKKFGGPGYRVDDPKADHTNAAIDASDAQDYAFAIRSFRAAARYEPNIPEVWLNLAFSLVDEPGKEAQVEAREALTRCLKIEPKNKKARDLWAEQIKREGWPAIDEEVKKTKSRPKAAEVADELMDDIIDEL